MTGQFDFRCPAMECPFEADTFAELRGHVNGKRPHDEHHEHLPALEKHEFIRLRPQRQHGSARV